MDLFLLCPACENEGEHEILKEDRDILVKCVRCGHVYHVQSNLGEKTMLVKAIVSHEDISSVCQIELLPDEECSVGDLHVAECGDEAFGVEVTGIEVGEQRKKRARAKEISALWTRMVEKVAIKASIHDRRITVPLTFLSDGEEDFEIGKDYRVGSMRFRISHMKLRDGAMMRKEGWKAYARKIKRIYGIRL